jgi:MraZ protein
MFVGNHEHTIDDKGRLILPSSFRARLAEGAYVTTLDHCLAIVPTEEFSRMADRLDDEVSEGLVDVNAVRAFFSQADFVTPDSQGRIRLLPHLRELVGLDRAVIVTGYNRRIEVWDPEQFSDRTAVGAESLADAITRGRGVGRA